jgi:hypothetical protein
MSVRIFSELSVIFVHSERYLRPSRGGQNAAALAKRLVGDGE